eukprot:COSAG04_NODE_369_length_15752_cov_6.788858_5_plen_197_part_00
MRRPRSARPPALTLAPASPPTTRLQQTLAKANGIKANTMLIDHGLVLERKSLRVDVVVEGSAASDAGLRAGALLTEIRDLSQSGDWRQVAFDDFEDLFRAVRENDEDGRADIALRFANPKRPRSPDEEDEPGSKRSRNADSVSVSVVLHLDGDWENPEPGSTILWNAGLAVNEQCGCGCGCAGCLGAGPGGAAGSG